MLLVLSRQKHSLFCKYSGFLLRTSHCLYYTVVVISMVSLFPKRNSFNEFNLQFFYLFVGLCHTVIIFCLCKYGYIIFLDANDLQTILLFAEMLRAE